MVSSTTHITEKDILDCQSANFADDVPVLLPEMLSWTISEVEEYFLSDGQEKPGKKREGPRTYVVTFKPRIALRKEPSAEAPVAGIAQFGTTIDGTLDEAGQWVKLSNGSGYAMLNHPQHGLLLSERDTTAPSPASAPTSEPEAAPEPEKNSLKKTFEKKVGACVIHVLWPRRLPCSSCRH